MVLSRVSSIPHFCTRHDRCAATGRTSADRTRSYRGHTSYTPPDIWAKKHVGLTNSRNQAHKGGGQTQHELPCKRWRSLWCWTLRKWLTRKRPRSGIEPRTSRTVSTRSTTRPTRPIEGSRRVKDEPFASIYRIYFALILPPCGILSVVLRELVVYLISVLVTIDAPQRKI